MESTWRARLDSASYRNFKPTNMEAYYFWFLANSESKQKRLFKYALGRLAKEHPDRDPREIILEFFADSIYMFEQRTHNSKTGDK